MTLSSVIWIPIVAIWKVCRELDGNIFKRIYVLTLPTEFWGPALPKHRMLVTYVDGFQNPAFESTTENSTSSNPVGDVIPKQRDVINRDPSMPSQVSVLAAESSV
ncbi:hypothetical protein HELRODRAFT_159525 [Helobdella robusta]|uniref:Uncharacterized protein n=1 Tax=Helobdella robusta TaxID=6412 RepID=T1EP46_HELRO|nr:hypothetical protein HELRODRAFT_159525 [Helobdella robusta]ESO12935.1 hypothetical protein HELRODRAFT_159525 [Helobdella robusta]